MWVYKSPIGNIYIKRQLQSDTYDLIYDNTVWGHYESPISAASNVYVQVSGITDWDLYDASNIDVPTDLSEWEVL